MRGCFGWVSATAQASAGCREGGVPGGVANVGRPLYSRPRQSPHEKAAPGRRCFESAAPVYSCNGHRTVFPNQPSHEFRGFDRISLWLLAEQGSTLGPPQPFLQVYSAKRAAALRVAEEEARGVGGGAAAATAAARKKKQRQQKQQQASAA